MNKSESITNLAVAMVAVQADMNAPGKNAVNPFFKSKYANLESHVETIVPVLNKNGLSVIQLPAGNAGVSTMLMHTSGEWIEQTSFVEVADDVKNPAQEAGKAISYLRRYALAALVCTYSGEDNDGNTSRQDKPKAPKKNTDNADPACTCGTQGEHHGHDCPAYKVTS